MTHIAFSSMIASIRRLGLEGWTLKYPSWVLLVVLGVLFGVSDACRKVPAPSRLPPDNALTRMLRNTLKDVDRIRIRSGGLCHRNLAREKTLAVVRDPDEIHEFIALLVFDPSDDDNGCLCCGGPTFEFYRGNVLAAALSLHHARKLRWVGTWHGDAPLLPGKADALVAWLSTRGVKGPRDELREDIERMRRIDRWMVRALRGLSSKTAAASREGFDPFRSALHREYPHPVKRAVVIFSFLGAHNGDWSARNGLEDVVGSLLDGFSAADLQQAISGALLGRDRQARRGAARYWTAWRSPQSTGTPKPPGPYFSAVLDIMQEARYCGLRQQAMSRLMDWQSHLAPAEVTRRLRAGLRDPRPEVRRRAVLVAGQLRNRPSESDLIQLLRGASLQTIPLPEVPATEKEDVPGDCDEVAPGMSFQEIAAVGLGYLGSETARRIVVERLKTSPLPAYRVAAALLGQPEHLEAADFRTKDRNQTLQLAAVEAVVRSQGRRGLVFALGYQQATGSGEEKSVTSKLKQMLLSNGATGHVHLEAAKTLEDLRAWYAKHGEAYLKQITAVKADGGDEDGSRPRRGRR